MAFSVAVPRTVPDPDHGHAPNCCPTGGHPCPLGSACISRQRPVHGRAGGQPRPSPRFCSAAPVNQQCRRRGLQCVISAQTLAHNLRVSGSEGHATDGAALACGWAVAVLVGSWQCPTSTRSLQASPGNGGCTGGGLCQRRTTTRPTSDIGTLRSCIWLPEGPLGVQLAAASLKPQHNL